MESEFSVAKTIPQLKLIYAYSVCGHVCVWLFFYLQVLDVGV